MREHLKLRASFSTAFLRHQSKNQSQSHMYYELKREEEYISQITVRAENWPSNLGKIFLSNAKIHITYG